MLKEIHLSFEEFKKISQSESNWVYCGHASENWLLVPTLYSINQGHINQGQVLKSYIKTLFKI